MKFSLTYTAAAIFLAKGALGEDVTTVSSTTSSSTSFTTQSTSTTGTWTTTSSTSSSTTTGEEAEFPGCRDFANWASSDDENCQNYGKREYCTRDGNTGAGWDTTWGNIVEYTDGNGVDAFVACCACGGGMEVDIEEITEQPQPEVGDVDEETTAEKTSTVDTTSTVEDTTSAFEETTSTFEETTSTEESTSTSTGESTSTSTGESTSTSTGESTSISTGESASTGESMSDEEASSTTSSSSSSTTSSTSTSTGTTSSTDVLQDDIQSKPINYKNSRPADGPDSSTSTSTAAETTSSTDNAVEGDKDNEDGIMNQATDSASTVQSGMVLATACFMAALAMVV